MELSHMQEHVCHGSPNPLPTTLGIQYRRRSHRRNPYTAHASESFAEAAKRSLFHSTDDSKCIVIIDYSVTLAIGHCILGYRAADFRNPVLATGTFPNW